MSSTQDIAPSKYLCNLFRTKDGQVVQYRYGQEAPLESSHVGTVEYSAPEGCVFATFSVCNNATTLRIVPKSLYRPILLHPRNANGISYSSNLVYRWNQKLESATFSLTCLGAHIKMSYSIHHDVTDGIKNLFQLSCSSQDLDELTKLYNPKPDASLPNLENPPISNDLPAAQPSETQSKPTFETMSAQDLISKTQKLAWNQICRMTTVIENGLSIKEGQPLSDYAKAALIIAHGTHDWRLVKDVQPIWASCHGFDIGLACFVLISRRDFCNTTVTWRTDCQDDNPIVQNCTSVYVEKALKGVVRMCQVLEACDW